MLAKFKLSTNRIWSIVALMVGIPSALFWGIGIFAVFGPDVEDPVAFIIVCLCFFALSIALICLGYKQLLFLRLCNRTYSILSPQNVSDIRQLAGILGLSQDRTRVALQKMINRAYLRGLYLDFSTDKIVYIDKEEFSARPLIAVKCTCCGGSNMLPEGTSGKCTYCDSAINGITESV